MKYLIIERQSENMKFETMLLHQTRNKIARLKVKSHQSIKQVHLHFNDLDELEGFYQGNDNYLYSRVGNPNTDELGETVASLEGATSGVASSSGLSAILAGVLAVVKSGDHIVAADDLYGGSFHLIKDELNDFDIDVTIVPFSDLNQVEEGHSK